MNHELDFDRDHDREDALSEHALEDIIKQSIERENELMRTYLIAADRIHTDPEIKKIFKEFAEGNAKRSRQLLAALRSCH